MSKQNISISISPFVVEKIDKICRALNKSSSIDWNRSTTIEYLIRKLDEIEYLRYLAKQKYSEFQFIKALLDDLEALKTESGQQILTISREII